MTDNKLVIKFEGDTVQDAILINPNHEQDSIRDRDDLAEIDKIKITSQLNGGLKIYAFRGGKKVRTILISPYAYDGLRLEYEPILEQPEQP